MIKSKVTNLYDFHDVDLKSVVEPFTINEEEIAEEIKKLAKKHGRLVDAERVESGDFVTIKSVSEIKKFNKESISLTVGKNLFDKEVEQQLIGMTVNETKSLADCRVEVKKIQRRIIPDLTDEYIASLNIEGISSLTQLKESIIAKQKDEYIEDYKEALAVYLSERVNGESSFELAEDEIDGAKKRSRKMADDMLAASGLDVDKATDEQIRQACGRSKEEHYQYLEDLFVDGLKSAACGQKMLEEAGISFSEEDYLKALKDPMEYYGFTLEQTKEYLPFEVAEQNFAADYNFGRIEEYVNEYLMKESVCDDSDC